MEHDSLAAVRRYFEDSAAATSKTGSSVAESVLSAAALIADCFASGGKLLLAGNGGSAADCQHVAAEFTSRLSADFEREPLPAVALTTDTSFLTAYANDYSFDGIFARQVEALGREGDVLWVISTSGRSPNIKRAVAAARSRRLKTLGLLGAGEDLSAELDCAVVVPDRSTQHVQEAMLVAEHVVCQLVEERLFSQA